MEFCFVLHMREAYQCGFGFENQNHIGSLLAFLTQTQSFNDHDGDLRIATVLSMLKNKESCRRTTNYGIKVNSNSVTGL